MICVTIFILLNMKLQFHKRDFKNGVFICIFSYFKIAENLVLQPKLIFIQKYVGCEKEALAHFGGYKTLMVILNVYILLYYSLGIYYYENLLNLLVLTVILYIFALKFHYNCNHLVNLLDQTMRHFSVNLNAFAETSSLFLLTSFWQKSETFF